MSQEIFIDCTIPITNIKPKRGQVLVELLPNPKQIGSILLPESVQKGGLRGSELDKFPAQEGLVRKFGADANPYSLSLGDRVFVRYYAGTNMVQPPSDIRHAPRKFKLLKATEIEAVFV